MQYNRPPDRRPMSDANKLAIFVIVLVIFGAGAASIFFNNRGSDRLTGGRPTPSPAGFSAQLPSASEIAAGAAQTDPTDSPAVFVSAEPEPEPEPEPTSTPEPNYYMTPTPTDIPTLKLNSSGEEVREMQRKLIELGYLREGADDAQFGRGTQNAVKAFQAANGLGADGAAGAKTLTLLFSDEAKPKPE